jgi:hypothetical protein
MALQVVRWELSLTLQGEDNSQRTKTFEIEYNDGAADDAAAYADASSEADSLVSAFDAITDAAIIATRLTKVEQEDTAPTGLEDVNPYKEAVATLALDAGGFKKATLTIPAPADSILTASGREIDTSVPAYLLVLDRFEAGNWTRISDGESIRDTNQTLSSRVRTVGSGKSY